MEEVPASAVMSGAYRYWVKNLEAKSPIDGRSDIPEPHSSPMKALARARTVPVGEKASE